MGRGSGSGITAGQESSEYDKEGGMRRIAYVGLTLALATGLSFSAQKTKGKEQTFTGNISDSMCGLKHMMPGRDKACTEACVKEGSKYVLADSAHQKVYQLSDQTKPKDFAGQKVKVTGSLKGDTISVDSIEAAK
jgi:uncharacterized protein DUF5818